jgi:predicted DNA-binding WGR domain protein
MYDCLHKINHMKRQSRFYTISLNQTLFGEACVTSESGRIGTVGKILNHYFDDKAEAIAFAESLRLRRERRGYSLLPVQLPMI